MGFCPSSTHVWCVCAPGGSGRWCRVFILVYVWLYCHVCSCCGGWVHIICVCVHVCGSGCINNGYKYHICIIIYVCLYHYVWSCIILCVCSKWQWILMPYMCTHVVVCVCVCMCVGACVCLCGCVNNECRCHVVMTIDLESAGLWKHGTMCYGAT